MLNKLIKDSKQIPQTFRCKLYRNTRLLTLEDQKEALTKSKWSYLFARVNISGSNIKALQAKACEDPCYAYLFAKFIPGADIQYCQEYACKNPASAYAFARYIPGADKEYCQEYAYKNLQFAYKFRKNILKDRKIT